MIRSIELRNWKTHKNTRIEFRRGVNVILGVMGAGKSSVLDAMSYALFGSFPDLNSKRTSINGLITSRPSRESEAEVRLTLDIEGSEYVITRKISSNSPSMASIEKDGKNLQTQPERVTEAVVELLKVDYDTFARAIYAQQNKLDYFLDLTKAERKRGIDNMLGLDAFAIAEENSTSIINSTRNSIKEEEEMLSAIDTRELRGQLEALSKESSELEAQQSRLSALERELKSKQGEIKKRLDSEKDAYERRKKLEKEISAIKAQVGMLSQQSKEIADMGIKGSSREELKSMSARREALRKEHEALEVEKEGRMKDLLKLQHEMEKMKSDSKERDSLAKEASADSLEKLAASLSAGRKGLEALHASGLSCKSELEQTRKLHSELASQEGKCPVCERPLDSHTKEELIKERERHIKELEKRIADDRAKAAELDSQVKALQAQHDGMKLKLSRLEDYKGLDSRISSTAKLLEESRSLSDKASRDTSAKAKELDSLKDRMKSLEMDVEKLDRKARYDTEIEKDRKLLASKEGETSMIRVDEKSIYALQDELTSASSKLSDTLSKIEGNGKYLNSIALQMKDKQSSIDTFSKMEGRVRTRRAMLSNMNVFKSSLVETEALLRNRLVESLNTIMQSIWPQLYPYQDYVSIRIDARKDDYLLQARMLQEEDSWVPIDSIASGGERSVACLAMRIALSMVIVPNLKWIILDEPTHNIDSNGIGKLVSVLGETLPNVVEQVFVITHDDTLKQIRNASTYEFTRDKAVHGFTDVSTG